MTACLYIESERLERVMDILFAKGSSKKTVLLSSNTIKDIALNELIDHMGGDAEERDIIKKLMSQNRM